MADVLTDKVMLKKECRKFGSEIARMTKDERKE